MKNRKDSSKWTQFMDMRSGGGLKEGELEYIYIEAPEEEANVIFYKRFGHSPNRVSCTCCGNDYLVTEAETLAQATGYNRNCRLAYFRDGVEVSERDRLVKGVICKYVEERGKLGEYVPLSEYLKKKTVLVIRANEIKEADRYGEIPEQGYVWQD